MPRSGNFLQGEATEEPCAEPRSRTTQAKACPCRLRSKNHSLLPTGKSETGQSRAKRLQVGARQVPPNGPSRAGAPTSSLKRRPTPRNTRLPCFAAVVCLTLPCKGGSTNRKRRADPCTTFEHCIKIVRPELYSPTAESFGVSAQKGSGVVWGGFHQGSTRVPPGFHEVLRGLRGGASTKKSTACCWGYHLSLFQFPARCNLFNQQSATTTKENALSRRKTATS